MDLWAEGNEEGFIVQEIWTCLKGRPIWLSKLRTHSLISPLLQNSSDMNDHDRPPENPLHEKIALWTTSGEPFEYGRLKSARSRIRAYLTT